MRNFFCLVMCLVGTAARGQEYEVIDRAGRVSAHVTIERGRMFVTESTGERIVFIRERRYDSADGRMLGFLNLQLQRVLRFPRDGDGVMQVADLDDPQPRFRNTLRSIRPAEVDPMFRYVPAPGLPQGWPSGSLRNPWTGLYGYPTPLPRSLLIESKTIANPPLEPANLTLVNGGPRDVLISLVDLKFDQHKELLIHPQQRVQVAVERDAGARRLQRYQTVGITGAPITTDVVAQIAPAVRYEIIVHERVLQSIAIDRTGKSPSPIEEANYRGRGLGRFVLPPGDQLQSSTMDVYRAALSAQNRGSVAPITAQEKPLDDGLSPLEKAVLDLQRKQQPH